MKDERLAVRGPKVEEMPSPYPLPEGEGTCERAIRLETPALDSQLTAPCFLLPAFAPPIAKSMKKQTATRRNPESILSHSCLDPVFFAGHKPMKTRRILALRPEKKRPAE
jgi:hypothetical protein